MSDDAKYQVRPEIAAAAHVTDAEYQALYRRSIDEPEQFWAEQAESYLAWFQKWDRVMHCDFRSGQIQWFEGGTINAAYNCLDRHLAERGDQDAIIWEGDQATENRTITYRELHEEVCRFANVLKSRGVNKGRSRVDLYADDPRGCSRDAGVREDWRDPLCGIWRLFSGFTARSHP